MLVRTGYRGSTPSPLLTKCPNLLDDSYMGDSRAIAIDSTNTNLLWASVMAETFYRLGLQTAVICPGSRSAPLAIAFANHAGIASLPVLDERSAAFFALGRARQSHQPVVLICTSGTAGANFFPAIVEATESQIPLLVLTADRPPELRDCNAGQAVDQQKLYGTYPRWYCELALPAAELPQLAYLRQTTIHAWERSQFPIPGAVHLNCPLREPLAPLPQPEVQALGATVDWPQFFVGVMPLPKTTPLSGFAVQPTFAMGNGVILAGSAQPPDPEVYCRAIAHISHILGYPVLADALSPLRHYQYLNSYLIASYDVILRQPSLASQLMPKTVIRIGEMPTSKQLRSWLAMTQPQQWIVEPSGRNLDPLHGHTTHLRMTVEQCAATMMGEPAPVSSYLIQWLAAEAQVRQAIDRAMHTTQEWIEPKVAWLLAHILPEETPVFISSSMPVRDAEWFWLPQDLKLQPFFNRGANGIDGTLSTALGVAHGYRPSVLLTGDLALLHDTNGFLLTRSLVGHLTIVLINNNGGGIFDMLPIAQFEPPFTAYFATPQAVDFASLCAAYGVTHTEITSWEQLAKALNPLPETGVRVLEIRSDRAKNARWRQQQFAQIAENLALRV